VLWAVGRWVVGQLLASNSTLLFQPTHRGAPIEAAAILALLATLVGIYSLPGVGILCLVRAALRVLDRGRVLPVAAALAPSDACIS